MNVFVGWINKHVFRLGGIKQGTDLSYSNLRSERSSWIYFFMLSWFIISSYLAMFEQPFPILVAIPLAEKPQCSKRWQALNIAGFYALEEGWGLKESQLLKSMAEPLSERYTISGTVAATKYNYINLHVFKSRCSISVKLFIFLSFQPD